MFYFWLITPFCLVFFVDWDGEALGPVSGDGNQQAAGEFIFQIILLYFAKSVLVSMKYLLVWCMSLTEENTQFIEKF